MIKILAIPGSLRARSSSNLILRTIIALSPKDCEIEVFDMIGRLPHFDDSDEQPPHVIDFKKKIREADAVLLCTPEYAFGIPGSLKNALDWTVGSGEFVGKPVAIVTASSQGEKGHAALLLVSTAMSAKVVDEASLLISSVRARLDSDGNIKDNALEVKLRNVVPKLLNAI